MSALGDSANRPSLEEILAGYETSLVRMRQPMAYESVTETLYEGDRDFDAKAQRFVNTRTVRQDGNRLDMKNTWQSYSRETDQQPATSVTNWLIKTAQASYNYQEEQDDRHLTVGGTPPWELEGIVGTPALHGRLGGDGEPPVPQLMREAASLSMRGDMESIDGHETCVVEATGPYGKCTMWIDPACGFNPRRIVLEKGPNDLLADKPLSFVREYPSRWRSAEPRTPKQKRVEQVDFELQEVDGQYFPVGARHVTENYYTTGEFTRWTETHTRTDIELNPDFETLGAFVPNFPDGTPVTYQDGEDHGGIRYEWREGRVVPAVDKQ